MSFRHDAPPPSPAAQPDPPATASDPSFEALTLWEVLGLGLRQPESTLRRLIAAVSLPQEGQQRRPYWQGGSEEQPAIPAAEPAPEVAEAPLSAGAGPGAALLGGALTLLNGEALLLLGGYLVALLLAILGASQLWQGATDPARHEAGDTGGALTWFSLAIGLYLWVNILYHRRALLAWVDHQRERWFAGAAAEGPATAVAVDPENSAPAAQPRPDLLQRLQGLALRHAVRLALVPIAVFFAVLSYTQNTRYDVDGETLLNVELTTAGLLAWGLSILLWFLILGVEVEKWLLRGIAYWRGAGPAPWRPRLRWRPGWQHVLLLLIFALGMYFRLHELDRVPPDMTSDHIEKLLDAVRVYDGNYAVFFPNNGGREAFQMYVIAGLVRFFGQDFSFQTLILATALEGLLTLLLGYALGRQLMGWDSPERRERGIWLGLAFALLLAFSSWHVMLSRLALRIVLTPLVLVLVLLFLIPALRRNSRLHFVVVGFWLGAGLYFYQAARMIPLLVVAGTGLAILGALLHRRWGQVPRYGVNLLCAAVMAVVVFLPMYHYQQAFPGEFWNRTRGRLFGENAFVRVNPETQALEAYEPSTREQLERFFDEFDQFRQNYVDALEMWSWEGDGAWINNAANRPALDLYTNALLILGLGAWVVLILRRREAVFLLFPLGVLVMLLPSALTLAYQIENPSFTRASGTIPFIFMMAALPLADIALMAQRVTRRRWLSLLLLLVILSPMLLLAAHTNYRYYFEDYRRSYANSWKPYSAFAAPLQSFALGEGSYGNAFMVAYPHWLDHRILAASAGDIRWDNGLVVREDVYAKLLQNRGTAYAYDPDRPLFFMYHAEDSETRAWLQRRFPGGTEFVQSIPGREGLNFFYYLAPPRVDYLTPLLTDRVTDLHCAIDC